MRKFVFLTVIILIVFCSFLAACDSKNESSITENDDVILGSGVLRAFNFEVSVKKSDLIAQVEIIRIVEELNEPPVPSSIIEAKIIETFKGDKRSGDKIRFVHTGTSKYIYDGYPVSVYEKGSQFILFLYKASNPYDPPKFKDVYFRTGEYTGSYHIITIDNEQIVYRRDNGFSDFADVLDKSLVEKAKTLKRQNSKKYEEVPNSIQALKKDVLVDLIKKETENEAVTSDK